MVQDSELEQDAFSPYLKLDMGFQMYTGETYSGKVTKVNEDFITIVHSTQRITLLLNRNQIKTAWLLPDRA